MNKLIHLINFYLLRVRVHDPSDVSQLVIFYSYILQPKGFCHFQEMQEPRLGISTLRLARGGGVIEKRREIL